MSKRIVVVTGLVASTLLLGPVARAQNPAPAPTEQPPAPPAAPPAPPAAPSAPPAAPPTPPAAPSTPPAAPATPPAAPSTPPAAPSTPPAAPSTPPAAPALPPAAPPTPPALPSPPPSELTPAPLPAPAPPAPPAAPPAPPAAPEPSVAPPPAPAAPAPAGQQAEGEKEKDKDEVKDGVRMRGGFSINGGVMFLPNGNAPSAGPSFGFAGRIGVQINHYLGIVYQNTPIVTFTPQQSGSGIMSSAGFKAGFADYNSFLFMVTLGHFFDIGAGPSVDFLAVANGHASIMGQSIESSSGISPGAHARIAFNIGGLSGNGPRRSGFAIGADAHPLFTGAGKGLSLTAGLGGEWY